MSPKPLGWYCIWSVLSQVQNPDSRYWCVCPSWFSFLCIKISKFISALPKIPKEGDMFPMLSKEIWTKYTWLFFSSLKCWPCLLYPKCGCYGSCLSRSPLLKPHEDGDMSVLALPSLGIKTPKIFGMFLSSCSSLSKVGRKSIMEHSPLC